MTDDVKIEAIGGVGHIVLNRPKALHALNAPMCEAISAALTRWRDDSNVYLVVITHADDTRGFCAGGDIRMLADSGAGNASEARAFFKVEYRMNVAFAAFPKPVLAIMDGVTMGGGVGLAVHGSHAVATERTLFAMPETGIGLFPDVGGGWFLPRLEGALGTWLALTGARLKGADVAAAKIATHFVPSELIPNLKKQIETADFSIQAADMLNEILKSLSQPVTAPTYASDRQTLDACFGKPTAEEIVAALEADGGEWALKQLAAIKSKSPETVKLALRQLQEGARCETFEDNMRIEYRIGWRKVQSADFIEGVRAVIIDKDHAAKWSPATLQEVTITQINAYFEELGADELTFD